MNVFFKKKRNQVHHLCRQMNEFLKHFHRGDLVNTSFDFHFLFSCQSRISIHCLHNRVL